ncbi:MAG: protein kinase [Ignavibacteria bacterium]|nr:protein kinase [Ignavibacteria bacterium]
MIGQMVSQYRILKEVGRGGMGVVYLAEDTRLDRRVAIKSLPRDAAGRSDDRGRLIIEAKAAASLNHRCIATIHAIEESNDETFIVMEYIEGEELRAKIDRGPIPYDEVQNIATQIAHGLAVAHRKGIVHRDIKSSNIMITEEGQVKIMDFGLAKMGHGSDVTSPGTTIGTIAYMSPEQARGEDLDHRSDIWSFGVVLYEMLTGELPFKGDYDQVIIYSILNQEPKLFSGSDREGALHQIVRRSLVKEPSGRMSTMEEIIEALETGKTAAAPRSHIDTPVVQKLAVLPFVNMMDDPRTNFLGFALADQIIGSMSYSRSILVRPSSSVRKFQGEVVDTRKAGTELNVRYILTGSYLKEAEDIRLTIELIDLETDRILWREAIEVRYRNAFELQDIVTSKVVEGLHIQFSEEERQRMKPETPKDPAAYEFYLRALSYPHTVEGGKMAISMLEKSIDIDPNYAPAYVELGIRYNQMSQVGQGTTRAFEKAEKALLRAISLRNDLLPALAYLALIYTDVGRHEEAHDLLVRAVNVNPNDPWIHFSLSYHYRYIGFLEEAATELRKALAIDPGNPRFRSGIITLMFLRQYEEAESAALDRESPFTLNYLGEVALRRDDTVLARAYFGQVVAMKEEVGELYFAASLLAYLDGDHTKSAEFTLKRELENPSDGEILYEIARVYGLLGKTDDCRRALQKSIDLGYVSYPSMAGDSFLDSVKEDPGILELLERARGEHEVLRKKLVIEAGER